MRIGNKLASKAVGFSICSLFVIASIGCQTTKESSQTYFPVEEVRVTSTSSAYTAAARGFQDVCANPAEFGRCGCYMDGLLTSCSVVSACLEAGFCKLEKMESQSVRSSSPAFSAAAKAYAPVCPTSAEFGRCGCYMDGLRTSCSFVNRCLQLGFCKVAPR